MEVKVPEPVGKEYIFLDLKFKRKYGFNDYAKFLWGVSKEIDCICDKNLILEDIAFIHSFMGVQDVDSDKYLCHLEGQIYLAVGNPPRKRLIENFKKYYRDGFSNSLEKFAKVNNGGALNLDCIFSLKGYGDVVSKKVEVPDTDLGR